jgi:hypothetical protein
MMNYSWVEGILWVSKCRMSLGARSW